jgi:putative ABC transport system ATP-binding protein
VVILNLPLIKATNLSRSYGKGEIEVRALREVSFEVMRGEFVSIMGASGSGKSTLLHLLGCLDKPSSGKLLIDDENISNKDDIALSQMRGNKLGFVFQSFNLIAQLNVKDNVELPMVYGHLPSSERHKCSEKVIELVGLSNRVNHKPTELSGGQAQRVAIARALVNSPQLLLADEPTGNLDSETGKKIISLFQRLNSAGLTIVMVTHDNELANHTSRIIKLKDGIIESDIPVQNQKIIAIDKSHQDRTSPTGESGGDRQCS